MTQLECLVKLKKLLGIVALGILWFANANAADYLFKDNLFTNCDIITNKDPVKSILRSVKDIAYNPNVKAIIVFSNSGKSAKLVSSMRPAAKIVTISPNINVSRQVSLLWGVQSINSRDANGWKDMMSISKKIIKKLKFIKKNDFVIITAGLPFGKAGMTNMVRLYKVGS